MKAFFDILLHSLQILLQGFQKVLLGPFKLCFEKKKKDIKSAEF